MGSAARYDFLYDFQGRRLRRRQGYADTPTPARQTPRQARRGGGLRAALRAVLGPAHDLARRAAARWLPPTAQARPPTLRR